MNLQSNLIYRITLTIIIALLACSCALSKDDTPKAENGILDLRNWNFEKNGHVTLNGEWKFIWMKHDNAAALSNTLESDWETAVLPNSWQELGKPEKGYSWLKLKVLLPPVKGLGIYLSKSYTSSEIFINTELILQSGNAGSSLETSVPKTLPVFNYIPETDQVEIIWKVSNFHGRNGGPKTVPQIGFQTELHNEIQKALIFDGIILGSILLIGIYNILIWLGRKEDRTSIYFALFCILIFFRMMSTNSIMQILFNDISLFSIMLKLEYLSITLGWTVFIMYLEKLYKKVIIKILSRIFKITGLAFSAVIIVTPTWLFTSLLLCIQIILILAGLFLIFTIILAIKKRLEGAVIVLAGFIAFFAFILNDILLSQNLFQTSFSVPVGLLVFIFFQSITLSIRYAKAFRTEEYLSKNLKKEIDNKTAQLTEQKKELENTNRKLIKTERIKELLTESIVHDINNYASAISGSIELFSANKDISETTAEKLSSAKSASRDIVSLTSNLLDINKMEESKMNINIENIGFKDIKNIIDPLSESLLIKKKQIKFRAVKPNDNFSVNADSYLFRRVLQNLLSNAVKHTKNNGKIEISFKTTETENIISVYNTGEPIPEKMQPVLFDKYLTINKEKSEFSKGLGLYFCKMVMENHKGRIWTDNDSMGNYFYISFLK
jgi:signal transduction histidine kinase